jgi:hypothetical protein
MVEADEHHQLKHLLHAGRSDREITVTEQRAEALARRSGGQHRGPAGERESASKDAVAKTEQTSAKDEKRNLR